MTFKYTDFFAPEDLSLAKCWMVVSSALFKGKEVSQVQREEMEKAFYIGFTECFKIITDMSDELPEDKAAGVLDRLAGEAAAFHEWIVKEWKGGKL